MVSRWRGRMSPKCRRSSVASLGSSSRSHDGHDRSIHETDVGVRVPIAQVSDPPVADGRRILHCVRSISDVAHQRDQRTRVEMTADQEVDLDQDRCWDDEGFLGRLDEGTARRMVGVRSIQRRLGRAGVRDQRHERGSGRSPADRRAVSVRPDAPMPMLRGHGRIAATLSSDRLADDSGDGHAAVSRDPAQAFTGLVRQHQGGAFHGVTLSVPPQPGLRLDPRALSVPGTTRWGVRQRDHLTPSRNHPTSKW